MIQAGAITTGSAQTDLVVGPTSASRGRATTAPLISATVSPGLNAFAAPLRSLRMSR
jgi:hypothetical protein